MVGVRVMVAVWVGVDVLALVGVIVGVAVQLGRGVRVMVGVLVWVSVLDAVTAIRFVGEASLAASSSAPAQPAKIKVNVQSKNRNSRMFIR